MTQQRREKPLPPFLRAPDAHDLPMEQWRVAMLPEFQYLCGRMGNWNYCALPRCRRSRTCTGSNDLNKRDPRFPPCIGDNDDHARLIREVGRYEDELQAAYHCFMDRD